MNKLKIGLLLSLPFLSSPIAAKDVHHHQKHINLGEHNDEIKKILTTLDGVMINSEQIITMIKVCGTIRAILDGDMKKESTELRIKYSFRGQSLSITELANIEADYVGDAELNALLVEAKNNFAKMVEKFIKQAKGVKELLEKLIEESCARRNRKNSILLTWASSRTDHEMVIFHTEIQSFKSLTDFCQDLENYLLDLMHSCPKAREQYRKALEKYKAEQNKQ